MSARNKLNTIYIAGSIAAAASLGLVTGSWMIFGLSLGVVLALKLYDGSIRPKP